MILERNLQMRISFHLNHLVGSLLGSKMDFAGTVPVGIISAQEFGDSPRRNSVEAAAAKAGIVVAHYAGDAPTDLRCAERYAVLGGTITVRNGAGLRVFHGDFCV